MENADLQERLLALEARLEGLEKNNGTAFSLADVSGQIRSDGHTEASDDTNTNKLTLVTNKNTLPEVRECNFMEFKNRFTKGTGGHYAVEALVSGRLLEQEIIEEQRVRERRTTSPKSASRDGKKGTTLLKAENTLNLDAFRNAQSNERWIRSVRLQSPALLMILSKIQGEPWSNRPRSYERPFTSLFYFHDDLKKALADLEDRWAQYVGSSTVTSVSTRDLTQDPDQPIDDCPKALEVMRAYIEYAETRLMPEYTQFVDKDFSSNAQVRFTDLWYLFRTGELIYRPIEGSLVMQQNSQTGKRIWKTYCLQPCATQYRLTPSDHRAYDKEDEESFAFIIHAYYLEYTGEEFCVATKTFTIPPYDNAIPVSSLPVFPVRFLPNWQSVLETATDVGNKALHYIETKHASHKGWSVIRSPAGDPMTDASGKSLNRAEHINGDIMVDFVEAFQACPSWKPERLVLRPQKSVPRIVSDDFPIMWWPDDNRSRPLAEISEIIPLITGVHIKQQNEFLSRDALLSKLIENDNRGKLSTREYLREEDKCLVTGRVFAYVFQERKFVGLEIQQMWQSSGTQDALDSLRISQRTKDLIQSSVKGHLLQKAMERMDGQQQNLDVIHGKGGGLFILLYGIPGVGKTATAEAIAQANGKPLFKITCGDLGLTPDKVETSLKEIFRLAGVWDCILLLDEVDTFFSARSKGDSAMHKNALVSVFLSIMDYYTGILFLTTNLVGSLDEAFKSRIHCKINYSALTKQQTLEIWQNNIARMRQLDEQQSMVEGKRPLEIPEREILQFAVAQFDKLNYKKNAGGLPNNGWNGRQIRNACQIARSLAYADAAKEEEKMRGRSSAEGVPLPITAPAPRLKVRHLHMIHEISDSFDQYIVATRSGMTDSQVAHENEVRADNFIDPWTAKATTIDDDEDYGTYSDSKYSLGHGHARSYFDARPRSPPPHLNMSIGRAHRGDGSGSGGPFYIQQDNRSAVQNRQPQTLATPSNGPTIMFRGASPSSDRGEFGDRQPSPIEASPRFAANTFHSRSRESIPRRGDYNYEQEYRDGRNPYGKRERHSDDMGPTA